MLDDSRWYEIMHITDSSVPTGGFAFSNGLESAVKLELIYSEKSLHMYLESYLEQVSCFDFAFMNSIYQTEEQKELIKVLEEYNATLSLEVVNKTSQTQGKSFLRILGPLYSEKDITKVKENLIENGIPLHYLVVFTLGLKKVGLSKKQIQRIYLYNLLRDQLSAAIRLSLIQATDAHVLQKSFYQKCEKLIKENENRFYEQAEKISPLLELSQSYHEKIYTKLFQN